MQINLIFGSIHSIFFFFFFFFQNRISRLLSLETKRIHTSTMMEYEETHHFTLLLVQSIVTALYVKNGVFNTQFFLL
jgi:hypothetical protein